MRLALGSTASNRSAKIRRAQALASQKKRRVRKINAIRTPPAGRSASRLRYWLCTRSQTPPHAGHRQTLAAPLIAITKPSSSFTPALNDESARNKLRNVKPIHGSDPQPESEPSRRREFIKSESDPILDADRGAKFDADGVDAPPTASCAKVVVVEAGDERRGVHGRG